MFAACVGGLSSVVSLPTSEPVSLKQNMSYFGSEGPAPFWTCHRHMAAACSPPPFSSGPRGKPEPVTLTGRSEPGHTVDRVVTRTVATF